MGMIIFFSIFFVLVKSMDAEEALCSICLASLASHDFVRLCENDHKFHIECLLEYTLSQAIIGQESCPNCRAPRVGGQFLKSIHDAWGREARAIDEEGEKVLEEIEKRELEAVEEIYREAQQAMQDHKDLGLSEEEL